MKDKLEELSGMRAKPKLGGSAARIADQHTKGKLTARERLDMPQDSGSFQELDRLAGGQNCGDGAGGSDQHPLLRSGSIGLRAAEVLKPGVQGRVLASFSRACDLVTDQGQVMALACDVVGDGPFNIVLEGTTDARPAWPRPGTRFRGNRKVIELHDEAGDCFIDLSAALCWDPTPDWSLLAGRRRYLLDGAKIIAAILTDLEVESAGAAPHSATRSWRDITGQVVQAHRQGDTTVLFNTLYDLCGCGPGLTPAGDDWLAGWLLGLRGLGDVQGADNHGRSLLRMTAQRTTALSRALLACAAAGEVDATWHTLLSALAAGSCQQVETATRRILSHGATSGAAMLLGFLAGLGVRSSRSHPGRGEECLF